MASDGIKAIADLAIRLKDVDFTVSPTKIHIRKEYSKTKTEPQSDHSYEALYSENYRLKEALAKATQFTKADQISTNEIGFTIPKEKYEHVKAAMENSKDSVFLIFDKSGILERAESDVLTETKK